MANLAAIDYTDGDLALQGWLLDGGDCGGPAPGILVFHEFMGLGPYLVRHLENFAGLGYVVMAADMYGRGVRPGDAATASALSRPLVADRPAMRRRARAAFDCMGRLERVDSRRIAAVGCSFGGCVALELARSGASLKASVSLYGYLDTSLPAAAGAIEAKLLVVHGMHDPVVPMAALAGYGHEMAAAGTDSRVVTFMDAGHGFCNRGMDGSQDPWNRYSSRHDQQAWQTLTAFLEDAMAE